MKQCQSPLADEFRLVAFDLRGHGMSEAPLEPEHYTDGRLWADDLAAVIDQLGLDRVVLVGWSYGPFVIGDYLRTHGQDRIAAINFVEGAVKLGEAAFGTLIGPGFLDHFAGTTADDLPTNICAMRSFVQACVVKPVSDDDLQTAMCWNSSCRPRSAPISPPASSTATTCWRPRRAGARHPRPGRLGRAPRDGRACPDHLPDRRSLLVRRRRAHAAPRDAEAVQTTNWPRATRRASSSVAGHGSPPPKRPKGSPTPT